MLLITDSTFSLSWILSLLWNKQAFVGVNIDILAEEWNNILINEHQGWNIIPCLYNGRLLTSNFILCQRVLASSLPTKELRHWIFSIHTFAVLKWSHLAITCKYVSGLHLHPQQFKCFHLLFHKTLKIYKLKTLRFRVWSGMFCREESAVPAS